MSWVWVQGIVVLKLNSRSGAWYSNSTLKTQVKPFFLFWENLLVPVPTERVRKENCSWLLSLECEEGYPKRRPYNRQSLPWGFLFYRSPEKGVRTDRSVCLENSGTLTEGVWVRNRQHTLSMYSERVSYFTQVVWRWPEDLMMTKYFSWSIHIRSCSTGTRIVFHFFFLSPSSPVAWRPEVLRVVRKVRILCPWSEHNLCAGLVWIYPPLLPSSWSLSIWFYMWWLLLILYIFQVGELLSLFDPLAIF